MKIINFILHAAHNLRQNLIQILNKISGLKYISEAINHYRLLNNYYWFQLTNKIIKIFSYINLCIISVLLSNTLTSTNLLITLLMVITNIILLKYIINSKMYKNIISSKWIKELMESQVLKYIKNSIIMKVILTTILSLSLKIILVNIFLFLILPILVALLPLVIFLDNIILSNVSETNLKLIIESTTNYYTDSSGSSSNSPNLCNKILKLISNLFKIKTKTVYRPLLDAEVNAEEDDFNTHVNNRRNIYTIIYTIQGEIYPLEVSQESYRKIIENIQLANEREVLLEDDRTKDQSKWWYIDSENLLLKEILDEPSSRLLNDNLKNLKLNKIRKRAK